jgi:putative flippase GtrA
MSKPRPAFAPAEFLRFLVTGGVGFVVDSGLLMAFVHGLGWPPLPARLASFAPALVATWQINRLWTFRAGAQNKPVRRMGAEFLSYGAVQVTGATANFVVYAAVVAVLGHEPLQLLAAIAAGAAIGLAINYLGARRFVFARVTNGSAPPAA